MACSKLLKLSVTLLTASTNFRHMFLIRWWILDFQYKRQRGRLIGIRRWPGDPRGGRRGSCLLERIMRMLGLTREIVACVALVSMASFATAQQQDKGAGQSTNTTSSENDPSHNSS